MAKNKKKKGKPTIARCMNCKFDRPYPKRMVDENEHFFCAKMQDANKPWQVFVNLFWPKHLNGINTPEDERDTIQDWIENHGEFNTFGKDIGKIVTPCPGFEHVDRLESKS